MAAAVLSLASLGTWAAVTHEWVWYGAVVAAVILLVLILADMGLRHIELLHTLPRIASTTAVGWT